MGKRIVFISKEIRDSFFDKVLNSYNFLHWVELRKKFNLAKSLLENYRVGKLTLPEILYAQFSRNFSEKDAEFFNGQINFMDSNWGSVKAGNVTYSKHKNIFDEGRKKAIISRKKEAEDKFDINMPLDLELAYFLGLFIGDGFTNKYQRYYMIELTGDKRSEKNFYITYMSSLVKKLFNLIPRITEPKNTNALRFIVYSKTLFKMITQRFKISAGRKSRTVLIPEEILNSSLENIKACIRGLYDAEGCVFLDRRERYTKPYPRIELHMCNLNLLKQVHLILNNFGIKSGLGESKNNLRITIWGFEEVSKFAKEIGFFNPKQLKKLELIKDY